MRAYNGLSSITKEINEIFKRNIKDDIEKALTSQLEKTRKEIPEMALRASNFIELELVKRHDSYDTELRVIIRDINELSKAVINDR